MKPQYSVFILALIITAFAGCKQDFDVTSSYKEIPVVYALLSQQDSANNHYVRIQKAYLIKGNAVLAAGVADSIYYPDILKVQIKELPTGNTYNLVRVNGNTIGLPKDTSGPFASSPNYLYFFHATLNPAKTYRLEITDTVSGKMIYAQDSLVADFAVSTPSYGSHLNLTNVNPSKVVWAPSPTAGVYDLTLRFFYKEYDQTSNTLIKSTYIDIPYLRSYQPSGTGSNIVIDLSASSVLNYIANKIDTSGQHIADPSVYRVFNKMQVNIAAGGSEFGNYINSLQAQSGLASNEALPPYTNIVGGVGLFSSRYTKTVDSVLLSTIGLDTLACSDVSGFLRFKNGSGVVCY